MCQTAGCEGNIRKFRNFCCFHGHQILFTYSNSNGNELCPTGINLFGRADFGWESYSLISSTPSFSVCRSRTYDTRWHRTRIRSIIHSHALHIHCFFAIALCTLGGNSCNESRKKAKWRRCGVLYGFLAFLNLLSYLSTQWAKPGNLAAVRNYRLAFTVRNQRRHHFFANS